MSKFVPSDTCHQRVAQRHPSAEHTVWRSVGLACPTQNGAIEPLFSGSWANAEDAHRCRSEYVSRVLTANAVESPFGHAWRIGSEMPCCLLWDHELFFSCVRVRAEGAVRVVGLHLIFIDGRPVFDTMPQRPPKSF